MQDEKPQRPRGKQSEAQQKAASRKAAEAARALTLEQAQIAVRKGDPPRQRARKGAGDDGGAAPLADDAPPARAAQAAAEKPRARKRAAAADTGEAGIDLTEHITLDGEPAAGAAPRAGKAAAKGAAGKGAAAGAAGKDAAAGAAARKPAAKKAKPRKSAKAAGAAEKPPHRAVLFLGLGVAWLTFFFLAAGFGMVGVSELWPFTERRGLPGDGKPFRVVIEHEGSERRFSTPDISRALDAQGRLCSVPQGRFAATITPSLREVKDAGGTCEYAIGTGPNGSRLAYLQCGLNEFVYEIVDHCAVPVQRKLLDWWKGGIAILFGLLMATWFTKWMRRWM